MRGAVYFVDLSPRSGSEQGGRRPCVVVSTDAFNRARGWRSISVVPITSAPRWLREAPTSVLLSKGESGLPRTTAILAHQITTIDRSKLMGPPVGTVSPEKLEAVEQAIRNYLEL